MLPESFARVWAVYPRREARKDALKAWGQVDGILEALAWQIQSDSWQRGYVPYLATYLRGERWTDERPESPAERAERAALVQAEAEFAKWKAQGHPAYTPYATFQEFRERRRA
jgi:hypothetical protein